MAKAIKEPDKKSKELLVELRDRYTKCVEFERENRDRYREDMRFIHVPGEQWDESTKKKRGVHRPMYEFNHTRVTVKNVINTMRSNRPAAKIRGAEDGDKPTAEAYEGIAKNIWQRSDGDSIIDYTAEHQCGGGFGAWRVDTKYVDDTAFEQDIVLTPVHNPLCLYADYACQDPLKRDASFWILHSRISKDAYKKRWPNAEVVEFEREESIDFAEVDDDDRVWICEYWRKEPAVKTLCQLSTGEVVDKEKVGQLPEGVTVLRERRVNGSKIVQYICSGDAILEGPLDWAGKEFPFVMVYGDYAVVDGKPQWCGVARYMKDPQRAHNWAMTSVVESIASAPNAKHWATAKNAEGLVESWAQAQEKNLPFQLYNPDPATGGAPPQRLGGPEIPAALMQTASMMTDEMKASSGIYDASLGARSNEQSGRAINARAQQGMIATFNFSDNMLKGVQRTYEILIDLIPKIYDTPRQFRILGADGAEKYIKVNTPGPDGQILNDLNRGRYDITVTAGPSFATQRMEAADAYIGLSQSNPAIMAAAGDLVVKSLDLPFSEQIAERMRAMLPPPVQQMISQGGNLSPESQIALAQADAAMQAVQQQGQLVQQAAEEAQAEKSAADKAKADIQVAQANLKAQEADLGRQVAEFKTLVAETQAKMADKQVFIDGDNERAAITAQVSQALADIQSQAAQMLAGYAEQMAAIMQSMQQPQVVIANPPKRKMVKVTRVNGALVGEMIESPETMQ